jgi:hypothetical protein
MERYFFHVFNDEITLDEEGSEYEFPQAARASAAAEARNLAAHSITAHGHLVLHHRIEVEDAAGRHVTAVTFGEAVEVRE